MARIPLIADATYAVPSYFASMQDAWDYIRDGLDLCGHKVTVNVANGYYAATFTASGQITGAKNEGAVSFVGNVANPSQCYLDGGTGDAVQVGGDAGLIMKGFGTQGYRGVVCTGGTIILGEWWHGPCSWAHLHAVGNRAAIQTAGVNYTIGVWSPYHVLAERLSEIITLNCGVTLSGSPDFTSFAHIGQGAAFDFTGSVYSGFATGKKFDVRSCGIISANGGSENLLPGSVAGTKESGGQYV